MQQLAALSDLYSEYDLFLFDAYGVLVTAAGPVPGAARILSELQQLGKAYLVVTNDASKLPTTAAARYRSFGLPLAPEQIVSSGLVLQEYLQDSALVSKRLVVFGNADSREYVRRGGAVCVEAECEFDAVVFADDADTDFHGKLSHVFSRYQAYVQQGTVLPILLANPDIIYPRGNQRYGIAVGAFANCFAQALAAKFPNHAEFPWLRLGKPYRPIFESALRRFPGLKALFVGDTLETDIAGAQAMGIDTLLISSGVSGLPDAKTAKILPKYVLHAW